jgi:hypothetical protein
VDERFGPDQPWAIADPTGRKCSPRCCAHHPRCLAAAGYRQATLRSAQADDAKVV